MTHCELLLKILNDGKPHSIFEILERGKGMNWAVRSRISNLRDKGYNIITLTKEETKANAWYQLKETSATGKSDSESAHNGNSEGGYPEKSPAEESLVSQRIAGTKKCFQHQGTRNNSPGISSPSERGTKLTYQTINRPKIIEPTQTVCVGKAEKGQLTLKI